MSCRLISVTSFARYIFKARKSFASSVSNLTVPPGYTPDVSQFNKNASVNGMPNHEGEFQEVVECPPNDYTSWHNMIMLTRNTTGDNIKCSLSEKRLACPPGKVQVIGVKEEVEEMANRLKNIVNDAGNGEKGEVPLSPIVVHIKPSKVQHLKLLKLYSFPNTITTIDKEEKTLHIFGDTKNAASIVLAYEFYEKLLDRFEERCYTIMTKQFKFFMKNKELILPEIIKICTENRVRFKFDRFERTFLFRGLPHNTKYARCKIERYFTMKHGHDLYNFFPKPASKKLYHATILVDHLKINALFSRAIGNVKLRNPQVEFSTLPGKNHETYMKMRSTNQKDLDHAVSTITDFESKIIVKKVQLDDFEFDRAKTIIMSGSENLSKIIFKDVQPKVLLKYDKLRTVINISGMSREDVEMATNKMKEFIGSIEKFETVSSSNINSDSLKKMRAGDQTWQWDTSNDSSNLLILYHQNDNKISVLGGQERVERTLKTLYDESELQRNVHD